MKKVISLIVTSALCFSVFAIPAGAYYDGQESCMGEIVPFAEMHCTSNSRLIEGSPVYYVEYYDYLACSHGKTGYIHRVPHYRVEQAIWCNVCDFRTTLVWYETGTEECIHA